MARQFLMPSNIFSGSNALNDAISSIKSLGSHALIVTDNMMVKLGNVAKLTTLLDEIHVEYTIYSEINGEPTDTMIENGLKLYNEHHCDFLIAIGGGSPLDSMKAIAMMTKVDAPINTMMGKSFVDLRPALVAIPTTAGTGSEATMFTIITDTKNDVKMLLKGPSLIPDIAIIDPMFTMTAPKSVTAATGIDALCHAIEAYTSKKAQPLASTFALSAIDKIFKALPVCYNETQNEQARADMALAAFEAGCAFNNSSVTIIHGMSRPIGANFHIPHGLSNAVLLEACMQFVKEPISDKLAEIARFSGLSSSVDDKQATEDFFSALHQLLQVLNIPELKDIIPDHEQFKNLIPKMSSDAFISGSPSNTVYPVSVEDMQKIYHTLID